LAARLEEMGHETLDLGTHSTESTDYPAYGRAVAEAVVTGRAELGVAVCGSGIGISISANRVAGARAARCTCEWDARLSRQHNNANILALGARVTGEGLAESILEGFLASEFEGGRHDRRVKQIDAD
jgi:ribose 5-phosphate isomerase B